MLLLVEAMLIGIKGYQVHGNMDFDGRI